MIPAGVGMPDHGLRNCDNQRPLPLLHPAFPHLCGHNRHAAPSIGWRFELMILRRRARSAPPLNQIPQPTWCERDAVAEYPPTAGGRCPQLPRSRQARHDAALAGSVNAQRIETSGLTMVEDNRRHLCERRKKVIYQAGGEPADPTRR
jgi:hypothetical protein